MQRENQRWGNEGRRRQRLAVVNLSLDGGEARVQSYDCLPDNERMDWMLFKGLWYLQYQSAAWLSVSSMICHNTQTNAEGSIVALLLSYVGQWLLSAPHRPRSANCSWLLPWRRRRISLCCYFRLGKRMCFLSVTVGLSIFSKDQKVRDGF